MGYPDAKPALQAKALVINKFDHTIYGHLRVTANAKRLRIEFDIAGPAGRVATTVNALTVPVVL
ncbi:MAG TPA: hypothetical protein VGX75_09660 [bacterium]|nr:hypothetical protein [bacterium]